MDRKIYDPLRRKEVALTPEEEVRQGLIRWLHDAKGVSYNRMMSEYAFRCGAMAYRADVVVFGNDGSPLLLAECKAPSVPLSREVLEQGLRYNRSLRVTYMLFTNGRESRLARLDRDTGRFAFLDRCPDYAGLLEGR